MADKRHIINPHVDVVTATSQEGINSELGKFFIDVQPDHPLYDTLKTAQLELNKGIMVINNNAADPSIYIMDTEQKIVKISGNGSKAVTNYEAALAEASDDNVGQMVYIKEESTYSGVTYEAGAYVVVGASTLMKLATSTASGDLDSDVASLNAQVAALSETVKNKVDVKAGYSLVSDANITKLSGIENGAQVNKIEKIVVNGVEQEITDKTVSLTVSISDVEGAADGRLDNAVIDYVDEVPYLVLSFTEESEKANIMVDMSDFAGTSDFTGYTAGSGLSITDKLIAVKIGANETFLSFDADGSLVMAEALTEKITELSDGISANAEAITELQGQVSANTDIITGLTESVATNTTSISAISGDITTLKAKVNTTAPVAVENYATAVSRAKDTNIGQTIYVKSDSESTDGVIHLAGTYIVTGAGTLERVVASDGTEDVIETLNQKVDDHVATYEEKVLAIDSYTVNGYAISQEGGVELESKDIAVDDTLGESEAVMDAVLVGDSMSTAVRKLENTLGATVIAMTASLNDMNSQINWSVVTPEIVDNALVLSPNVLYEIADPVSAITLSVAEPVIEDSTAESVAYSYKVLMTLADTVDSISLPSGVQFVNMTNDELEANGTYLLEIQHNFARWTKFKNLAN